MEVLTFIGTYVLKAFQNYTVDKSEQRKMELELMLRTQNVVTETRQAHSTNKLLAITAAVLAMTGFFAVVLLPKLIFLFQPDVNVIYAYLETKNYLFSSGLSKMMFKAVNGVLISPIDTHLVAAISGLYFGSVTGRRG